MESVLVYYASLSFSFIDLRKADKMTYSSSPCVGIYLHMSPGYWISLLAAVVPQSQSALAWRLSGGGEIIISICLNLWELHILKPGSLRWCRQVDSQKAC